MNKKTKILTLSILTILLACQDKKHTDEGDYTKRNY